MPSKKDQYSKRLLDQLHQGKRDTLVQMVAHTLNHFPATRDSDIMLAIKLLQTFYPDAIDSNNKVRLNDFLRLPKFYDMQRIRAKIQNSYNLFLASPEIRKFRRLRQSSESEKYVASSPDFSPVFVFADESGKTDEYLILGTVWIYSAFHYHNVIGGLRDWRDSRKYEKEFHFNKIKDIAHAEKALSFFDSLIHATPFYTFKAILTRNDRIPANRRLDAVYDGLSETLIKGLKVEFNTARINPPITIHLAKHADPSTDVFKIADLNRRILISIKAEFTDGSVTLNDNEILSLQSKGNDLIQISDLFTSSLNRWVNHKTEESIESGKGWLAKGIGSRFGWHYNESGLLTSKSDVCNLIYL